MEMTKVQNTQELEDTLDEKTAAFLEAVAALYGVQVHIEDTDWQTVYDLKARIHESLAELGVNIEPLT